ncbi:uncharacterized protein RHO25_010248 [Cercospora beticola]|uniref:DUF7029 domain-containing protein n=1 Tax=Cercospora beticola TaxID=122368 RepID=A0ABZ0P1T5_CERBT|nr:hypothetical protein RHO25_010248 [Cercospora beticola]
MLSQLLLGLLTPILCHATPVDFDISRRAGSSDQPELPRLKPVVRWDRDLEEWTDLVPQTAQQLYFGSDDPNERHQFADMSGNFTGKAVVLQRSAFVTNVKCTPKSIEVTLSNNAAYSMVETEWQAVDDFMLVTNSDSCGHLSEQFSFWDVKTLKFSAKTLTVKASVDRELDIGTVLGEVKLSWGTWEPGPPLRHTPRAATGHRLMRRCDIWSPLECGKKAVNYAVDKVKSGLSAGAELVLKYHPGIVVTR